MRQCYRANDFLSPPKRLSVSGKKTTKTTGAHASTSRIGGGPDSKPARKAFPKASKTPVKGGQNVTSHARAREETPKKKTAKGVSRSLQVATAMANAMTNSEIAQVTGLSERQVKRIKADAETRLTFDSLTELMREELMELWCQMINATSQGTQALQSVVTIDEHGGIVGQLIPDFKTRVNAAGQGVKIFSLFFANQKQTGPMTITLENAKELLRQIRQNKDAQTQK